MSFDLARVAPEKAAFRPALPVSSMPGVNGTHMTKMTYAEQLKHPNWQRKRLEILERDGFACQSCYDKETTLHVHHKHYHKGAKVWEYESHELVTLCEICHEATHTNERLHNELFARLPFDGPKSETECLSLVAGYAVDRAEGLDVEGFITLDGRSVALGLIASRIGDALGFAEKPAAELANKVVAATEERLLQWIASLSE